jgi:hypothetical protein
VVLGSLEAEEDRSMFSGEFTHLASPPLVQDTHAALASMEDPMSGSYTGLAAPAGLLNEVQRNEGKQLTSCISQIGYFSFSQNSVNPFTASCENAITLSVPGVPASCEKFPHSIELWIY